MATRAPRAALILVAVFFAAFTVLVPAASANETFGGTGEGPGQFKGPIGAAVKQSSGNVYIGDASNQRVDEFDSSGHFLMAFGWGVANGASEFQSCGPNATPPTATCLQGIAGAGIGQFNFPKGIAIDQSTGDIYVVDNTNHRVQKFTPSGQFLLMFGGNVNKTAVTESRTSEQNVCPAPGHPADACQVGTTGTANGQFSTWPAAALIAVDGSGIVYVGDANRIQEFNSQGVYSTQITLAGAGNTNAVAVDSAGNVYEISASVPGVRKFNSGGTLLNTLDQLGPPLGTPKALALDSSDDLYVRDSTGEVSSFLKYDAVGSLLTYFGSGAIVGLAGGLAIGNTAEVLYAVDNNSARNNVQVVPLPTSGPYIEPGSQIVTSLGSMTATFAATINPEGHATTYYFQYLDSEDFENGKFSNPATVGTPESASIGEDFADHAVEASVSGLQPDTVYRYRVVARDAAATVAGPAQSATTNAALAGSPSGSCPNPAHTGLSARLPDCRAYELLTPSNKGDAEDMYGDAGENSVNGGTFDIGLSSENGDRFRLTTSARFGVFPASGENSYVVSRGTKGWQETSLASPTGGTQSLTPELSNPDMSQVGLTDETGSAGNIAASRHLGLIGVPGGPYTKLFDVPNFAAGAKLLGASSDFSRVFLESTEGNLVPGGPAEVQIAGSHALYEYANGTLSPVNVKTNGELLSPCGAGSPAGLLSVGKYANAVSANGSRTFFLSPDPRFESSESSCYENNGSDAHEPFKWTGTAPQLYSRAAGVTTEVSAAEAGVVDPKGPQPVAFAGATTNGSKVFFVTRTELTADDLGNHEPELYEYDTETEHLTRVSRGQSGNAVGNVFWDLPSPDGSAVYFTATGALAPGALSGALNLYRYDTATGATTYIAAVSTHDWTDTFAEGLSSLNTTKPINTLSNWETTPNGRYLLFVAAESLTGYNNHNPTYCSGDLSGNAGSGNCVEVYRYDAVTESLLCVSCNPSGATASANALFDRSGRYRVARAISDDGSTVFFDTVESLVPQDTNGRLDVYEWHEGKVSLLSSGQDSSNSYFLEASPDGRNVFFGTHARLVAQDTDSSGDLYDARVEGGFPAPQGSVACEGDACSTPPSPPAEPTLSTSVSSGSGNEHPARHHHRKHPKRHRRSHRRAGANRGGPK